MGLTIFVILIIISITCFLIASTFYNLDMVCTTIAIITTFLAVLLSIFIFVAIMGIPILKSDIKTLNDIKQENIKLEESIKEVTKESTSGIIDIVTEKEISVYQENSKQIKELKEEINLKNEFIHFMLGINLLNLSK